MPELGTILNQGGDDLNCNKTIDLSAVQAGATINMGVEGVFALANARSVLKRAYNITREPEH